jgi:hypothetical protein
MGSRFAAFCAGIIPEIKATIKQRITPVMIHTQGTINALPISKEIT